MDADGRRTDPLIFLIAGEPSGDLLGGRLMAALKAQTGGAVRFSGVGGDAMAAEGLVSLFPMADLSVMGLTEVLPRLPLLLKRISETADAARKARPAAVVTIDSPDFSFRVAKRLKGAGFPLIHYVAPTVWAWRPGRAEKIARFLDHLLALFPFEPPYFDAVGLPCTFVGHSVVESGAGAGDGADFRRRHGIGADSPLVCVLPGSRFSETSRLLPVFAETAARLSAAKPGLSIVMPLAETVAGPIADTVNSWPPPVVAVRGEEEKYAAFAAADVALAASGTVALELAMAGLPSVIAYRLNPLTAWIARRMIRVKYANLINITLDRPAVPEFLQKDCTADSLTAALIGLLDDEAARNAQIAAARQAISLMGGEGPPPSHRAASAILRVISAKPWPTDPRIYFLPGKNADA
ncbi:MAG: lipid-A-disaccharide synthase [Rhodospirillales bacterium]|nr:lipid-A-disaccharide synthase [Rhodospirillales bacterium]